MDIESEAVDAARQNAEMNGVAPSLELGQGSLAEIQSGEFSLQSAQLVLANILAPILIRLLDEGLGALLEPGGELVLSGILEEQVEDVLAAASRNGLRLADRRQIDDWVALVLIQFRHHCSKYSDPQYFSSKIGAVASTTLGERPLCNRSGW